MKLTCVKPGPNVHVADAGAAVRRRALLLSALLLTACGRRKATQALALPAGSIALALGDSITHGTGAAPEAAYPAQLARLSAWSVINGGVPGDTSAQALARLPALLSEHRPALVIVSLGGNDFLRRLPEADTEANLRRCATLSRDADAQVVLVAVPRPTLAAAIGAGLSDHPLYERVATDLALPLHAGGWARVLSDEKLRSDQIHANAEGYRVFAESLVTTLRAAGLLR
jgi:lysophospholipase L1-like esterase